MTQSRFAKDDQGAPLSVADLPKAGTIRWTPRLKAKVLIAIQNGLLSSAAAERMYALSTEELLS